MIKILSVSLFSEDAPHWKTKPRTIEFRSGKLNAIIGPPNSGKTTIWQIINFCLSSRDKYALSKNKLLDSYKWFSIEIQSSSRHFFLGRNHPSKRSEYFIHESLEVPTSLPSLCRAEAYEQKVNEVFPSSIRDLKKLHSIGKLGNISFRDLIVFNYLSVAVQTSNRTLLDDTKDNVKDSKLKYALPVLCELLSIDAANRDYLVPIFANQTDSKIYGFLSKRINSHLREMFLQLEELGISFHYLEESPGISVEAKLRPLALLIRRSDDFKREFENYLTNTSDWKSLSQCADKVGFENCSDPTSAFHYLQTMASLRVQYQKIVTDMELLQEVEALTLNKDSFKRYIRRLAEPWNAQFKRIGDSLGLNDIGFDFAEMRLCSLKTSSYEPIERLSDNDISKCHLCFYVAAHYPILNQKNKYLIPFLFLERPSLIEGSTDLFKSPAGASSVFQLLLNMLKHPGGETQVIFTERTWNVSNDVSKYCHLINLSNEPLITDSRLGIR